jgi:hypothetical protein
MLLLLPNLLKTRRTLPEYLSSLLVFSELGNKSNMTCVISDAGTVTLPEYLSSLLIYSELGNKSNMTCVILHQ